MIIIHGLILARGNAAKNHNQFTPPHPGRGKHKQYAKVSYGRKIMSESMAIDWTPIYKKYKGLWVALKQDEKTVIASGKDAGAVLREAVQTGYEKPIMMKVPQKVQAYVGLHGV